MKNRIASFALALVLFLLPATQAFALELVGEPEQGLEPGTEIDQLPGEYPAPVPDPTFVPDPVPDPDPDPVPDPIPEPLPEPDPAPEPLPETKFYLDGNLLTGLVVENINYTNYVTLKSIVYSLEPRSIISEIDGICWVSAWAYAGDDLSKAVDTLALSAVVGMPYVMANNRYLYVKDGVITINGDVAIPLRTIAKAFCMGLDYDPVTCEIFLTSPETPGYLADALDFYKYDDVYWMSRIIQRESGNQSMAGKVAVGNVVLNRVADPGFPNTITGVLFQKNQFCTKKTLQKIKPSDDCIVAAKLALDGGVALEGVLFFNRAGLVCFASKNRPYVATIGAHAFYA